MAEKVTEMSAEDARDFFLRAKCYSTIDLPKYFDFKTLLDNLAKEMEGKDFDKDIQNEDPSKKYSDVNYIFYQNKDGNLAWRKFELIHPVIYIHLVNTITEANNWQTIIQRFNIFKTDNIECLSIPRNPSNSSSFAADSVTNWWKQIVLRSIDLSLEYDWLANTDITDCYGSLYTHSIAWALHNVKTAKSNQSNSLIGNHIDCLIRMMTYGQTNGIPQGSILMDFIAEIVLGYADMLLALRLSGKIVNEDETVSATSGLLVEDYKILRYRDDYRIFTKTKEDAVKILKELSVILSKLNFKLNTQKTFISQELINDSIKPDKLYWNRAKQESKTLQNDLLLIHNLAKEHQNSGSVKVALTTFIDKITPLRMLKVQNLKTLVAILVDIAAQNSNVYAQVVVAIGKILSYESEQTEKQAIFQLVVNKLCKLPNSCFLFIWLQRLTLKGNYDISKCENNPFDKEKLCQVYGQKNNKGIWNVKWLKGPFQKAVAINWIIKDSVLDSMPEVPDDDEVKLFVDRY